MQTCEYNFPVVKGSSGEILYFSVERLNAQRLRINGLEFLITHLIIYLSTCPETLRFVD
mgnify:CR=1 FL=1